jgi:carbamoyltransferase
MTNKKKNLLLPELSIVIPAYNESKSIVQTLNDIEKKFSGKKITYEILIVNDGSTDKTEFLVQKLRNSKIRIINIYKNQGKGYALKKGFASATGKSILYMDADNSTSVKHFFYFYPYLKKHDVVVGSRILQNSKIIKKQKFYRIILGMLGGFLIKKTLNLKYSDTQCGFKLFKRNALKKIIPLITSKRWGIDFEILKIAEEKNLNVKELPVIWKNSPTSKVKFFDYFTTLKELITVKKKNYQDNSKKDWILAINDSITDCGIAYHKENKLIFAINEERFSRKKAHGGFPRDCLSYFVNEYKQDIPYIKTLIFPGISTPNPLIRTLPLYSFVWDYKSKNKIFSLLSDIIEYKVKITTKFNTFYKKKIVRKIIKKILRQKLPNQLSSKKIILTDHHLSHASAAFYSSGFKNSLVFSFDGFGDGYSAKIYLGKNNKLKRLFFIPALDSFGLFYSLVTVFLGFKSHRHEGKIAGLAAFGSSKNIKEAFPFKIHNYMKVEYLAPHGLKGLKYLKENFSQYRKEDIAAWTQDNTEKFICKIVSSFVTRYKVKNVCLSGGLFANVKINQRISELKNIEKLYIYPAMGDMGLSHGSILAFIKKSQKLENVFLGKQYSKKEVKRSLQNARLKYRKITNMERKIALLIAKGKIVARFNGKMEYGPRALGNRSILAQATKREINNTLNQKLNRTEFMPFAPVIIDKFAEKYILSSKKTNFSSKFMTISFNATQHMKKKCPAAVHVDGTTRPQVLNKKDNEGLYKIIKEYYKITNIPVIINTSFNAHEEPIVMSPEDAINSFLKSDLDFLAIENYLATK